MVRGDLAIVPGARALGGVELVEVVIDPMLVESYALGAKGYVNPYGNYVPRASWKLSPRLPCAAPTGESTV